MNAGEIFDIEQGQYGHILPCPFCGKSQDQYPSLLYIGGTSPPSYAVSCQECSAQGPTGNGKARDDHVGARINAVDLWNDRKGVNPEDAKRWAIEKLEANVMNAEANLKFARDRLAKLKEGS